jgi:hypothetical protein
MPRSRRAGPRCSAEGGGAVHGGRRAGPRGRSVRRRRAKTRWRAGGSGASSTRRRAAKQHGADDGVLGIGGDGGVERRVPLGVRNDSNELGILVGSYVG